MKFGADRIFALSIMPLLGIFCVLLLCLNPFLNPGPLFYSQVRMGKNRRAFRMIKFRSMSTALGRSRAHDAGLEESRITPLGRFLRKHRIDELPNMINVLRGEMSVIGPRPDAWSHAKHYCREVPLYDRRFAVRPGITGLAQVETGYADGKDATMLKAEKDLHYIRNYGFRQEARIVRKTFRVVFTGHGAR
ncbi:MAG: sugar transferase [Roseivivax sp.]|nr:sugar transferase [Roseivivax sp.]